jgi:cell division septation protein DedD
MSSKRSQTIELIGEYTYLEDNQSKKKEIEIQSLSFETPLGNEKGLDAGSDSRKETAVVNEKKKETKSQKKTPETKPVIAEPLQKSAAAPRKEKEKSTNKKKLQTVSPETSVANAGGMLYQVQVGAFAKKMVTTEKLEKRFKIIETINSEMSGGYTKFMVGNHREYKEARDHREKIIDENKIKSSFVVAYNDGKRITVQEALSITNQKWFK